MGSGVSQAAKINDNAGTTGFAFLKLGVGSQASAMGGAYTALSGDAATLYYNPAGSVNLPGKQFMAGYHNYVLDIQSGFVAVVLPATDLKLPSGKVGFFIDYLNYGTFTRTDADGREMGTFSGGDFLIGANYSICWKYGVSFGANAKFMTERADGYSAEALAADLGVMVRFKDSLTTAGLSVLNLGKVTSGFSDHKDKLPLAVRAGVSHHPRGLPLVVAIDGVVPNDNNPYVNIGTEMVRLKPLYIRAGYSTFGENYKTGSKHDAFGGFSFGFGLDAKIKSNQYHFAYAFMPYLDLGSSHRITITGGF
jgi:hypothetical protein